MSRQRYYFHDKDWFEVKKINSYAIFMGYLMMGVRGLGLLVLTWTTVVLLGGFVSMLQMKDFWCLTAITLVETAGVFDFLLKEKASDIVDSINGLLASVYAAATKKARNRGSRRVLFLYVVQVLALVIVLCPLMVLYVFGLYLSAGISLWRLIQHDYGNTDGGANLKPALNVLYSLAVAQGVVYGYRTIHDLAAKTGLVDYVAEAYSLETYIISDYLEETVAGCMKDPSFARGRNLITYAVDLLMESKTSYGYFSGVLILGKTPEVGYYYTKQRRGVLKQLLTGSASFGHVIQGLSETFGPRSPYSTEIKVRAATIVATVADSICLDQFPAQGRMLQCISSLLDTFEEYSWRPEGYQRDQRLPEEYERDWVLAEEDWWYSSTSGHHVPRAIAADSKSYEGLVVQGFRILRKLAANEDNCRVISNAHGLLSKAMAHLIPDKLHEGHLDEWCSIAEESLEFMNRMMGTLSPAEATRLGNEISSSSQAIMTILGCHKCDFFLKRQGAQVLLHLSLDTPPSFAPGGSSSILFVWILLDIFLLPDYHFVNRDSLYYSSGIYSCNRIPRPTHLLKKSSYTRRLAGEKMQAMVSWETEASDTSMQRLVGYVAGSLARTAAGVENNANRIHAATVLDHLCRNYTKDDENLKELKKAVANVMPEVLKEIIHWLRTGEIQVVREVNNGGNVLLAEEGLDLEQGGVSLDNDNGQSSFTPHQQKDDQDQRIRLVTLLNFCQLIENTWMNRVDLNRDQDLTCQFNEIAALYWEQVMVVPHDAFTLLLREAWTRKRTLFGW